MSAHRRSPTRDVCVECWKPWPCPASIPPCPHGMPTPTSCIDCMEDGNIPPPPPPPAPTLVAVFSARFPGQCPSCNLPIHPGQTVASWTDDRYRHMECTP